MNGVNVHRKYLFIFAGHHICPSASMKIGINTYICCPGVNQEKNDLETLNLSKPGEAQPRNSK